MDYESRLKDLLKIYADMIKPQEGLVYRLGYDFVFQHGKFFRVRDLPEEIKLGAPKGCFGNAIVLAVTQGFKYIEGYALHKGQNDIPVLHAWNADDQGRLIDNTWANKGTAYMGVEFSAERAHDATWNQDACVLDDYANHWPLFQKRWTGEDYTIQWPESLIIRLLREGKTKELEHYLENEMMAG